MIRADVINKFIEERNYSTYLEIGLDIPSNNFLKIKCLNKESCDPFLDREVPASTVPYLTYQMTSDELFNSISKNHKWDIIFIDGLHHKEQVLRDVINSLEHLNENGVVILHDCLPTTEKMQLVPR